jgi:hypothetical protein
VAEHHDGKFEIIEWANSVSGEPVDGSDGERDKADQEAA